MVYIYNEILFNHKKEVNYEKRKYTTTCLNTLENLENIMPRKEARNKIQILLDAIYQIFEKANSYRQKVDQ